MPECDIEKGVAEIGPLGFVRAAERRMVGIGRRDYQRIGVRETRDEDSGIAAEMTTTLCRTPVRASMSARLDGVSLGGDGSLLEPFPRRPKGMKRKIWWRLFAKASRDEQRGIAEMADALRCKSVHLT